MRHDTGNGVTLITNFRKKNSQYNQSKQSSASKGRKCIYSNFETGQLYLKILLPHLYDPAEEAIAESTHIKNTHREKAPSNKTPGLTESMNMGIWVVGTSNQFFIKGS